MAARAVAQSYNYISIKIELGSNFTREFTEFVNKMELGLGWLRAVAQCYNYSYHKIEFGSNFQRM